MDNNLIKLMWDGENLISKFYTCSYPLELPIMMMMMMMIERITIASYSALDRHDKEKESSLTLWHRFVGRLIFYATH